MKRFFLFAATVLWATLSAFAAEQNMVAIYQLDGQKALFAFATQPELSYSGTDLMITTGGTTVRYPICKLKKLQFETADVATGTDEIPADEHFTFTDGNIVISGGLPFSEVAVYTVSGILTAQYRLDANGTALIPTQDMHGTTYIVTTKTFSFKFMQP